MKSNLTDSFIQEFITKQNAMMSLLSIGSLLCFAFILVITVIAMIIKINRLKKDTTQVKQIRKTIVGLCITCGIFALIISGVFYLRQMVKKTEHLWTVSIETVTYKDIYKDHDSKGTHSEYRYQIHCDGYEDKVCITEKAYDNIEIGENVYLVCDVYGAPIYLWDMDEYNYTGSRWKEEQ